MVHCNRGCDYVTTHRGPRLDSKNTTFKTFSKYRDNRGRPRLEVCPRLEFKITGVRPRLQVFTNAPPPQYTPNTHTPILTHHYEFTITSNPYQPHTHIFSSQTHNASAHKV